MTANDDRDRRIRAFLDEGLTELPDRSFDAVRASIDRTRQRTVLGPWRSNHMPSFFRPAAMAAAVIGIAVIGVLLVNRPALPPGGTPAPTTTTTSGTPTAVPSTRPASAFLPYEWPGELAPGTYATNFTWKNPFQVAVTVPEGWQSRDIEVIKGIAMSVSVQLVDNIYPDPCSPVLGTQPIGQTVDDLVAAIQSIGRIDVSAPVTVSRSGFDGKAFSYTPEAALCGGPEGRLWHHPEDLIDDTGHFIQPTWPLRAGTHRVEIYDVNGRRLLIDAMVPPDAMQDQIDELTGVLGSLRILAQPTARKSGACTLNVNLHGAPQAGPPYEVTLGPAVPDELNGLIPVPFPLDPPLAWLDWQAPDWPGQGRGEAGGAELIPPTDVVNSGFSTHTEVGGPKGSVVFDAPGVWWFRISDGRPDDGTGCLQQFPVIVLPAAGG